MTPEGRVKKQIDALLDLHKAFYRKPVMNGMGKPMLDYVGHERRQGVGFHIEAKAPGGVPTKRQINTAREVFNAGGVVFLIEDDIGLEVLTQWLDNPHMLFAYWPDLFDTIEQSGEE